MGTMPTGSPGSVPGQALAALAPPAPLAALAGREDSPRLAYAQGDRHPLLRALGFDGVNLNIAAGDEMFLHCLGQNDGWRDMALVHYLRTAAMGARMMGQVIRWFSRGTAIGPRILDFASGYGRTTRFLVAQVPPDRIWVSDIQADGVAFQQRQFGVHALASSTDPGALVVGERFDLVFVLSLFSHLPDSSFTAWLKKLYSLLSDRGCLVFSTLGDPSLPPDKQLPPDGFLFSTQSESAVLPGEWYGTLWASESYVGARIAAACDGARWRRFPRALWHLQDLYVVARGEDLDPVRLAVAAGPEGYLDDIQLQADPATLYLRGWALDHDDHSRPAIVEAQVGDGPWLAIEPGDARPDVASALHIRTQVPLGWRASYRHPTRHILSTDIVVVRARGVSSDFIVHAAPVDSSVFERKLRAAESALRASTQHVEELSQALARESDGAAALAERIAWMEQSRFWKAREHWFRLKATLSPGA